MLEFVKISQLASTAFVTPSHVFLTVRDGATALLSWAELTATDLLVLVSGGETKTTTYANVEGALSGGTPPVIGADVEGTGFKISELKRTDSVNGADLFVVAQPGEAATITADAFGIRGSRLKRITFEAIDALLAPEVTTPITLYPTIYANDTAAEGGGVLDCGLYRISQGNDYGFVSPYGALLIRNPGASCAAIYANDEAALLGGVPLGGVYSVTIDNDYGIQSQGGRGVAVLTNGGAVTTFKGPFASNAAAEAAGVQINEAYIAAAGHELGFISGNRALVVRTS